MVEAPYYAPGYDDALDVNTSVAVEFLEADKQRPKLTHAASLPPLSKQTIRTLLVVDAACDLPKAWLDFNAVAVMPRTVVFRGDEYVDVPGTDRAAKLADKLANNTDFTSRSEPHKAVVMRDHMQRFMLSGTEAVLHLCGSARRSKQFVNALSATQSLVLIHNKVRRTLGQQSTMTAWVIDSMNALGGIGVLAAHAVSLRERGMLAANIAVTLNSFRSSLHTVMIPNDLAVAAQASRVYEQQSISGWKLALSSTFGLKPIVHLHNDQVRRVRSMRGHINAVESVLAQVEALVKASALATPFVAVSHAGRLDYVESLAAYASLRAVCNRNNVSLSLAPMSMTGMVALGLGATSVSFASQQYRP